jgi:hypothetical protein
LRRRTLLRRGKCLRTFTGRQMLKWVPSTAIMAVLGDTACGKSEATGARSVTRVPCGRNLPRCGVRFRRGPVMDILGVIIVLLVLLLAAARSSARSYSSRAASQAWRRRRWKSSAASARITNWLASLLLPITSPTPPKRSGHSRARPITRKASIDTRPGSGSLATPSALPAGAGADACQRRKNSRRSRSTNCCTLLRWPISVSRR